MITIPAHYRNKKTGKIYSTMMTVYNATNYADNELMVLYHNRNIDKTFVREITEFEEKFEYVNE
jgi:CTP synthase (UTP-ammonia lyase)